MTDTVRIEHERRFAVGLHDGFDYITDPANWPEYWPRFVRLDPGSRWQAEGDRARVTLRLLGREVELDMRLTRFEPYRVVEYTSEQRGLPPARHRRHFDGGDGELTFRLVVEFAPRPGPRGVFDRLLLRRAIERVARATIANLDGRLRERA